MKAMSIQNVAAMDLRKLDHLAGTPPKEIKQSVENRKAEAPFVLLDAYDEHYDPFLLTAEVQSSWQKSLAANKNR